VTVSYDDRARQHAVRRDAEVRRSVHISRGRLVTFLAAVGCLIWTLARGADPVRVTIALALFVVFGALVFWHARVEGRAAWHQALRTVSLRASARIQRRWDDLPSADAPGSVDLAHHPYALDLDLFGRA
jgi:Flp pilus assembly protein TadB